MRYLLTVFITLLFGFTLSVQAQDLSGLNFQNMNVENLSEQQVQQIFSQMQSRGLTIAQVEQLAVAQGMSRAQASRLSQKLRQASSGARAGAAGGISGRLRQNPADTAGTGMFGSDSTLFSPLFLQSPMYQQYRFKKDSTALARQKIKDQLFGAELFAGLAQSFEPALNIPTPKDYQLGPGDEVIIDIWGAAQQTYQLQVSPDGMIIIDNLGPVYINGLSVEEVNRRLKERLTEIYSGLVATNESPKDTYMQVTLGQIRSIKVTVLGEATQPGTYTLPSLATLFNALNSAGGPSANGTFRNIKVIRADSVAANFDLYDFLVYGDQSDNIRLQSQDIIKIDPYINRVKIEGEVKRPGLYEVKQGESLSQLVEFAGGFTGEAYTDRIRIIGSSDKERTIRDIQKKNFDNTNIRNGDLVTVQRVLDRFENLVEIQGAVFRPGKYQVTDSSTVYSLIQRADGLQGDAFMNRGLIYRKQDDYSLRAISFNIAELMKNPEEHDIALKKDDLIRISSIFDLREDFTIDIEGAVLDPGTYDFVENMTLEDIIFQAGGFKRGAAPFRIEVARYLETTKESLTSSQIANIELFEVDEDLRLNPDDANYSLKPFDKVYVRRSSNADKKQEVSVGGEIQFPGTYSMRSKNERISDLIERAGGITEDAYLEGATLYRTISSDADPKDVEQLQGFVTIGGDSTNNRNRNNSGNNNNNGNNRSNQRLFSRNITLAKIGIDLPTVINNPGSRKDLFLEEGDSLHIPKELQTVLVKGGVFYPTSIRYNEGMNYKDYITAAGGFSDLAKSKKSYVVYANGDVDRTKSFLFFKDFPDVKPGATIVVPKKQQARKLTPQERVSLISAIISTAALLSTTITQITNR